MPMNLIDCPAYECLYEWVVFFFLMPAFPSSPQLHARGEAEECKKCADAHEPHGDDQDGAGRANQVRGHRGQQVR